MQARRSMVSSTGQPTGDAVVRYTEGDCWHLAFELGRILDAPLVAIVYANDPEEWLHVATDLGRESLLDVLGVRTRDEILRFWRVRAREPLAFRELGRHNSLQDMLRDLDSCRFDMMLTRQDEEDCIEVARALAALNHHLPQAV